MTCKWKFRSYLENDIDHVRPWLEGLPDLVQARMLGQLQQCSISSQAKWERHDEFSKLTDDLIGLEQLRFVIEDGTISRRNPIITQYRILGFSDLAVEEFTMLIGFQKLRGEIDYQEYGPIALSRMRQVKMNRQLSPIARWLHETFE